MRTFARTPRRTIRVRNAAARATLIQWTSFDTSESRSSSGASAPPARRASRGAPGAETGALIARSLPRVRNVVAGFRLPEHPGVAIRPDDREDVVQDALRRAFKMLARFRGNAEGEWYAAVITCSRFTCRDHLRAQLAAERHLAGRLEDEVGEGRPRFEADLARLSEHDATRHRHRARRRRLARPRPRQPAQPQPAPRDRADA